MLASAFPLFTRQLWDPQGSLGPRWAGTLLGGIAVLLGPSPWIFYYYGPQIRKWSKFAPCIDFKIRDELEAEGELIVRGIQNGPKLTFCCTRRDSPS